MGGVNSEKNGDASCSQRGFDPRRWENGTSARAGEYDDLPWDRQRVVSGGGIFVAGQLPLKTNGQHTLYNYQVQRWRVWI